MKWYEVDITVVQVKVYVCMETFDFDSTHLTTYNRYK